jgi:hypothetical protein
LALRVTKQILELVMGLSAADGFELQRPTSTIVVSRDAARAAAFAEKRAPVRSGR